MLAQHSVTHTPQAQGGSLCVSVRLWKMGSSNPHPNLTPTPPLHHPTTPQPRRPEQWGYLVFLPEGAAPSASPTNPDPTAEARRAVMAVYHLQRDYKAYFGRYAATAEVRVGGAWLDFEGQ